MAWVRLATPSDRLAIIIIEALLFAFALFAIVRAARLRRQHGGATLTVMRGPESRKKLGLVYGFASVNTLQLINISDAFNGHKVVLSVVDLLILFYLCFLSSWIRNRILGWVSKWEATPE
jgi:hypothetical protein